MARQLLLDWGKNSFTLAEVSRNKKRTWALQEILTHHDPQEENASACIKKRLQQIEHTLKSWHVFKADLHCFLPAESVFLKTIRLEIPPGLEEIIPKLVRLEAKRVFLFPLEELIWDHHIFPSQEEGTISVLLAAVKKTTLHALLEIFSQTSLEIVTLTSSSHALVEAFTQIAHRDCSKEALRPLLHHVPTRPRATSITCKAGESLMIDLRISTTNVICTQSHEMLASYTLYEKGDTISSQENISVFLQQVIDHRASQKCVVEEILVTGTSREKQELLCFLQKKLTIKIDDLDKKLALNPPMMPFSEHDAVCSASFLAGGITFCEKKNHIHLDLLPASLLARRSRNQERPYTFRAMICIMCTLLAWSLYFQHASGNLMTLSARTQVSLLHEEEKMFSLQQREAQLARTEDTQSAIHNLLEKHLLWPHLLSELQKALPGHALFITKLSPIINEDPRGDSITALELEGISLESPQEVDAVHRFIQALAKSNLFEVNPQEKITSYDALSDEKPKAYPWKFRLSLKSSMSDIVD